MVHQDAYIRKILEKLNVGKSYPSPRVVRSLDVEKDPWEDGEEMLAHNVPYLNAIGPTNIIG